jgi:hypothetical protein
MNYAGLIIASMLMLPSSIFAAENQESALTPLMPEQHTPARSCVKRHKTKLGILALVSGAAISTGVFLATTQTPLPPAPTPWPKPEEPRNGRACNTIHQKKCNVIPCGIFPTCTPFNASSPEVTKACQSPKELTFDLQEVYDGHWKEFLCYPRKFCYSDRQVTTLLPRLCQQMSPPPTAQPTSLTPREKLKARITAFKNARLPK